MSSLPHIPGLRLLSEVHRDMFTRWFRVDSADPGLVVLFHDSDAARLATEAAGLLEGMSGPAWAPIVAQGELDELPWFRIASERGFDPCEAEPLGELSSLELLKATAATIGAMSARDKAHGALLQGGLELLPGPRVQVIPPFLVEDWLAERLEARLRSELPVGYRQLKPAARDLSALAMLAAAWIGGRRPDHAIGEKALAGELIANASPATGQSVRIILKRAGEDPTPERGRRAPQRVGWCRQATAETPGSAGSRPVKQKSEARARPSTTDARADRPRRTPKRRIPAAVGIGALIVVVVGLIAIGGGDAFSEFVSGLKRPVEELPTPSDPLTRTASSVAEVGAVGSLDESNQGDEPPAMSEAGESDTAALADRIIEDLERKRAERDKPKSKKKKPSYDRSLIDAGSTLQEQAAVILRDVRDRKVKHEDRNRRLEEAIGLLEKARENYIKFTEQYPDKEGLVERTLEDVTAMLRMAYKSKSRS